MDATDESSTTAVCIRLRRNGPLVLTGPVNLVREDGSLLREADSMALCRCGASREAPFCDGSHRVTVFRDD
ncbi:MAG: CDGSH iron-sulfur domain-containing protein [Gemmatimonadaceae bacterium]|nr:CDGSH iron-sulfur domain-containing protein [Gemmatimonadaceae bacterium]